METRKALISDIVDLRNRIKKEKGYLSYIDIAKATGMNKNTVSNVFNGAKCYLDNYAVIKDYLLKVIGE